MDSNGIELVMIESTGFRTGVLLSGGERLGPTEPGGETARRPVDVGSGPTEAERRSTPLKLLKVSILPLASFYILSVCNHNGFESFLHNSLGRKIRMLTQLLSLSCPELRKKAPCFWIGVG